MSSRLADIPVPPRCEEMIRAGALVAINHSGGKDSQTMTILLSRIVPRSQLVAVHAPLGEVEWPGTIEHIEATLPPSVPRTGRGTGSLALEFGAMVYLGLQGRPYPARIAPLSDYGEVSLGW